MPSITSIIWTNDGLAFEVTVAKDAPDRAAYGKIYVYSSQIAARQHRDPDKHEVGSWSATRDQDFGSGKIPRSARGKYVIVTAIEGTQPAWSEPFRAPLGIS